MSRQTSLFDYCIVDSFAGGGGASTGIEMATGHPVDVAINHNEAAIMMHRRNHPFTEHYIEDVWQVDPVDAVRGRHVRLAWFSPDCKHFSRAKGKALVDKGIRGLAWVVLKWAAKVRPDVIMLENVPEFVTWGPVRKGKPVKSKAGQTYRKWLSQLEALGYKVETSKICAADLGAPTIRTRFHLVARCDGRPIVFPEATHAPRDSAEVKNGILKPWRAAAEIIDFNIPCPSIFESKEKIKETYGLTVKRPLKPNTLQRIARGLDKFVIKSAEPFICQQKFANAAQNVKNPLSTVTAVGSHEIAAPKLAPYVMSNNTGNVCHGMDEPVPTITTGDRNFVIAPSLIQYHSEQSKKEVRGQRLDAALNTVDGSNRYGLSAAWLTQYFSGDGHYHSVKKPLATITTMEREGVTSAFLSKFYTGVDGSEMKEPTPTVTAIDHNALTTAHLAHFKGKDKGQHVLDPLMTVTACDGQFADVRTMLVKWDGRTDLGYWSEVRKLLNTYCDYNIADDEVLLLNIRGVWYYISDIGLRMLVPRELYDAMGFPHDYIIDRDATGKPIKREDQVARCGNAVCPAVAEALVRANLPECCTVTIVDMSQLHNVMTS